MENINENTSPKQNSKRNIGYIPFFVDVSIYEGLRTICSKRKQRMQIVMMDILKNHYSFLTKSELNTGDVQIMHKQLIDGSKQQKTSGIADFVEYACSKYLEREMDSLKPKIKRG